MTFRKLIPPLQLGFLIVCGVLYLGAVGVMTIVTWNTHLEGAPDPDFKNTLYLGLNFAMVFFGFAHFTSHPASDRGYADWLRSSPWTFRQPLPLGPLHLTWQD